MLKKKNWRTEELLSANFIWALPCFRSTNAKACLNCLSTMYHSIFLCHYILQFWLVPGITTLFIIASLWKWDFTVLCQKLEKHTACLAGITVFQIFCWGFSKADPEHQKHSKISSMTGLFLKFSLIQCFSMESAFFPVSGSNNPALLQWGHKTSSKGFSRS